jgi:hypothetical protein
LAVNIRQVRPRIPYPEALPVGENGQSVLTDVASIGKWGLESWHALPTAGGNSVFGDGEIASPDISRFMEPTTGTREKGRDAHLARRWCRPKAAGMVP